MRVLYAPERVVAIGVLPTPHYILTDYFNFIHKNYKKFLMLWNNCRERGKDTLYDSFLLILQDIRNF